MELQPHSNYLVCWVGKGLGSGVIRYVNGDMKFVFYLQLNLQNCVERQLFCIHLLFKQQGSHPPGSRTHVCNSYWS